MITRFVFILLAILTLGMQVNYFQTYATAYFKIKYEKSVPLEDIKKLGEALEHQYADAVHRFGLSLNHRIDVYVYNSTVKFRADSRSLIFQDGAVKNGDIFLMSPKVLNREEKLQGVVARVVTRAVLDEVPLSPPWLRECYSLYAGGDLASFGLPARFKAMGFSDLSEEFSTVQREKDVREIYAKLAVTADFLVNRYGEEKVEALFTNFYAGMTLDEAIENSLAEKIDVVEKAWKIMLMNPPKE